MKSRRRYQILTIIFFILFFGANVLYRNVRSMDKQTLQTTFEFTATVTGVSVEHGVTIHTEEYGGAVQFYPNIEKYLNLSEITSLKKGQTITFRLENSQLKRFADVGYGAVVALKTEEKEILSLEEYNQHQHEILLPQRITTLVAAIIFLLLTIYFLLKLSGIKLFRKQKKA